MAKVIDKLWNWGHLEGSHNKDYKMDCHMSPEQFAEEYGIRNAFIVSYGGNIQPPFHELARRMSTLKQIKWSVLGDASTPLPEARLGNTEDVIEVSKNADNITGGVIDDFFSFNRVERFTPKVLGEMRETLNHHALDFWCVLYELELDEKLKPYLDCFDGIAFWIWKCADIANVEEHLDKLFSIAKNNRIMLGVYLWEYGRMAPMDETLFRKQLSLYFNLLESGKIEGIVFCSSTLGDSGLDSYRILKEYISAYGDREVAE